MKGSERDKDYAATFRVKDLEGQINFYTETIGLQLQWRTATEAGLGACQFNILLLTHGDPSTNNETLVIEVPGRRELAVVVGRLCTIGYPNRPIDQGNRHATHLADPEGNRIDIGITFSDRAAREGRPLDIEALFNELSPDDRLCDKMPDKTRIDRIQQEDMPRG
jgi:catechol-2,3-dioxygenase